MPADPVTTPPPTALPALGPEGLRPWVQHHRYCDVNKTVQTFQTPHGPGVRAGRLNLSCTCGLADALLRLAQPEEPGLTEEERRDVEDLRRGAEVVSILRIGRERARRLVAIFDRLAPKGAAMTQPDPNAELRAIYSLVQRDADRGDPFAQRDAERIARRLASPSAQPEDRRDSDSKTRESLPEGYAVVDGKLWRLGEAGFGYVTDAESATEKRVLLFRLVGPIDTRSES